jgi:hypothetical protein
MSYGVIGMRRRTKPRTIGTSALDDLIPRRARLKLGGPPFPVEGTLEWERKQKLEKKQIARLRRRLNI